MSSPRRDPYLWIHLAGFATVPLWLDVCLAGLAVGDPIVPPWLELALLALVGTVPILWMQLQRPFYIFSVPGLALRPDKLEPERRQLLTMQRGWLSRGLVIISAIALLLALYGLYQLAPIAATITPFAAQSRATGWLIGAGAFLAANLFTQVPATVAPLLVASPGPIERAEPIESSCILKRFTVLGIRVAKILPMLPDAAADVSETTMSASPKSPASDEASASDEVTAARSSDTQDQAEATALVTDTDAATHTSSIALPSPVTQDDAAATLEPPVISASLAETDPAIMSEHSPHIESIAESLSLQSVMSNGASTSAKPDAEGEPQPTDVETPESTTSHSKPPADESSSHAMELATDATTEHDNVSHDQPL